MRFSCFGNATLFSRTSKTLNPLVFSGVRVTRTLVLYVCFVDRCLSFCPFSFGNCVVCSFQIYDSDCPFGIFKLFMKYLLVVRCRRWTVARGTCRPFPLSSIHNGNQGPSYYTCKIYFLCKFINLFTLCIKLKYCSLGTITKINQSILRSINQSINFFFRNLRQETNV